MKKLLFYYMSCLFTTTLLCCSEEQNDDSLFFKDNNYSNSCCTSINSTASIIGDYVQQISQSKGTRSVDATVIEPITYKNDTVMYLANYSDGGWDIFSAKFQAPMCLISSKDGFFSFENNETEASAFLSYIDNLAEQISFLSALDYVDDSWLPFRGQNITVLSNTTLDNIPINPPSNNLLGIGYWKCDTIITTRKTTEVPHIISDKWHQHEPYNRYTPLDNSYSPPKHSLVGCCAIATAEVLHSLYKLQGKNFVTYDSQTYNDNNNRYQFYNESNMWENLRPKYYETDDSNVIDSIALVMGYISNEVNHSYSYEATEGNSSEILTFLRTKCGLNASSIPFSTDTILNRLHRNLPLLIIAFGRVNGNSTGHAFVIDACGIEQTIAAKWYRWIGTDSHGLPTNTFGPNGELLSSRYQYREPLSNTSVPIIQMNWGTKRGEYDDTWFNISGRWQLTSDAYYNSSGAKLIIY